MRDAAISDFERIAATPEGGIHVATLLAQALVARGRQYARSGRDADARADWQDAIDLLEPAARRSKDPDVVAPWAFAHRLLDRHDRVAAQTAWLTAIGYADPQFIGIAAARGADRPSATR